MGAKNGKLTQPDMSSMQKTMGKPSSIQKTGNSKPSSMSHGKAKIGSAMVNKLK